MAAADVEAAATEGDPPVAETMAEPEGEGTAVVTMTFKEEVVVVLGGTVVQTEVLRATSLGKIDTSSASCKDVDRTTGTKHVPAASDGKCGTRDRDAGPKWTSVL